MDDGGVFGKDLVEDVDYVLVFCFVVVDVCKEEGICFGWFVVL